MRNKNVSEDIACAVPGCSKQAMLSSYRAGGLPKCFNHKSLTTTQVLDMVFPPTKLEATT